MKMGNFALAIVQPLHTRNDYDVFFQIGNLIPEKFNFGGHGTYMNPNVFKVNIGDISKKMLIELFKVMLLLWRDVQG